MKKLLTCLSVVLFVLSIISAWYCSIGTGITITIIAGVLGWFAVYLYKINAKKRIIVRVFIISLILLVFFGLTALKNHNSQQKFYSTQNEENIESKEDESKENIENTDEMESDMIGAETVTTENDSITKKETTTTKNNAETKQKTATTKNNATTKQESAITQNNATTKQESAITKNNTATKQETAITQNNATTKQESAITKNNTATKQESATTKNNDTSKVENVEPQNSNNKSYDYYGDPTGVYTNNYNYNPYGDPAGGYYNNNYSSSVKISGEKEVTAGESYTYTISGVNNISESKLKIPSNVNVKNIRGNKITLYFEEGWSGTYSIGYSSATIKVEVHSN